MTERPILFSAPMVRALIAGRKTQTRRVVKPQPRDVGGLIDYRVRFGPHEYIYQWPRGQTPSEAFVHERCPYGVAGDRLWVRETWCVNPRRHFGVDPSGPDHCLYRADDNSTPWVWTPSIHMPRWASRINLEISGVRVERLQEISEADARAEGIEPNWIGPLDKGPNGFGGDGWTEEVGWHNYMTDEDGEPCYTPRESFESLWQSINGRESWTENPWVWVVEFKRLEQAKAAA